MDSLLILQITILYIGKSRGPYPDQVEDRLVSGRIAIFILMIGFICLINSAINKRVELHKNDYKYCTKKQHKWVMILDLKPDRSVKND